MRKILIVFMMCALLVNIGCDDNVDPQSSKVNLNKVRSVQKLTYEAQRLSYQMLNNDEQLFIWNERFQSIVNSGTLTSEQQELIEELRVGLLPSLFDQRKNIEERAAIHDEWANRAMVEFSYNELYVIVANLSTPSPASVQNDVSLARLSQATMLEECTCNRNSSFTCFVGPAAICTEPAAGACVISSVGCGFSWLYPCNGRCLYV